MDVGDVHVGVGVGVDLDLDGYLELTSNTFEKFPVRGQE